MAEIPADQRSIADAGSAGPDSGLTAATPCDFGAHVVMFWLLVSMAALVFAPCILIPIWMETQELVRTEADVAARTARLKAHIARQEKLIQALTSDPLLAERIARRDLRFRRTGEIVEPVPAPAPQVPDESAVELASEPATDAPPPLETPFAVTLTKRWLPDLPWVELFGRPPNRTIFLVMAGCLLVAAFVLFGHVEPRNPHRPTAPRKDA
jgi:cell division protein FtsB